MIKSAKAGKLKVPNIKALKVLKVKELKFKGSES